MVRVYSPTEPLRVLVNMTLCSVHVTGVGDLTWKYTDSCVVAS